MSQPTVILTAGQSAFIERCGLLMTDSGLPRSVGRVFGLLLICEPDHQSAEAIQALLQLSAGSVSAAVTTLQKATIVSRITFSGDRRIYYHINPTYPDTIVDLRLRQVHAGVELTEAGLKLTPGNQRLTSLRHVYSEFERVIRLIKP
jgi:DNA-binding transcriptional regulator GbsR (MarR family)